MPTAKSGNNTHRGGPPGFTIANPILYPAGFVPSYGALIGITSLSGAISAAPRSNGHVSLISNFPRVLEARSSRKTFASGWSHRVDTLCDVEILIAQERINERVLRLVIAICDLATLQPDVYIRTATAISLHEHARGLMIKVRVCLHEGRDVESLQISLPDGAAREQSGQKPFQPILLVGVALILENFERGLNIPHAIKDVAPCQRLIMLHPFSFLCLTLYLRERLSSDAEVPAP